MKKQTFVIKPNVHNLIAKMNEIQRFLSDNIYSIVDYKNKIFVTISIEVDDG